MHQLKVFLLKSNPKFLCHIYEEKEEKVNICHRHKLIMQLTFTTDAVKIFKLFFCHVHVYFIIVLN